MILSQLRTIIATHCTCAIWAGYCLTATNADETPFIDNIRTAWKAREAKLRSFYIEWEEEITDPVGWRGSGRDNRPLPSSPYTYTDHYSIKCDANRIRQDRQGTQFSIDKLEYIAKSSVLTFDGYERREEIFADSDSKYGGGFIQLDDFERFSGGDILSSQPAFLFFRPLCLELGGIDLSTFHDTGRTSIVNDLDCRLIERTLRQNFVDRIWIAQTADYVVVRREFGDGENTREDLSISYGPHAELERACIRWSYSHYPSNRRTMPSVTIAKISRLQVNPKLQAAEFRHQFTPGIFLSYMGGPDKAIVLSDGSLRRITSGEWAADLSRDELMNTSAPPEAFPQKTGTVYYVLGIAVIATGFFFFRCSFEKKRE